MQKNTLISTCLIFILSLFFVLPTTAVVEIDEDTQVCGLDGVTYNSAEEAEEAGTTVSYEFACVDVESEDDLYEATSDLHFNGALIEIGSTDLPTTIIVRDNSDSKDYTVEVTSNTIMGETADQSTFLSHWIPGDQIKVVGVFNENTETVTASMLVNLSIATSHSGVNGWITEIDQDAQTISYQWNNEEYTFSYDDDTKFVVGGINPASADDLEVDDRIRGRLTTGNDEDMANIVVVLRRGEELFMKIRTFRPNVTVVSMDSTVAPTTITVKIEETTGLNGNDVNNLIGEAGTEVFVNVTEDTKIVRKYFGITSLEEVSVGDSLSLVGRVNDDGTVDTKLIKNNSVWKTSLKGFVGEVSEVNTDEDYIMITWSAINRMTQKNGNKTASSTNSSINRTEREVKVTISDDTTIMNGTDTSASISDISEGDKVRLRGTRVDSDTINADTIVLVNTLPELELDVTTDEE